MRNAKVERMQKLFETTLFTMLPPDLWIIIYNYSPELHGVLLDVITQEILANPHIINHPRFDAIPYSRQTLTNEEKQIYRIAPTINASNITSLLIRDKYTEGVLRYLREHGPTLELKQASDNSEQTTLTEFKVESMTHSLLSHQNGYLAIEQNETIKLERKALEILYRNPSENGFPMAGILNPGDGHVYNNLGSLLAGLSPINQQPVDRNQLVIHPLHRQLMDEIDRMERAGEHTLNLAETFATFQYPHSTPLSRDLFTRIRNRTLRYSSFIFSFAFNLWYLIPIMRLISKLEPSLIIPLYACSPFFLLQSIILDYASFRAFFVTLFRYDDARPGLLMLPNTRMAHTLKIFLILLILCNQLDTVGLIPISSNLLIDTLASLTIGVTYSLRTYMSAMLINENYRSHRAQLRYLWQNNNLTSLTILAAVFLFSISTQFIDRIYTPHYFSYLRSYYQIATLLRVLDFIQLPFILLTSYHLMISTSHHLPCRGTAVARIYDRDCYQQTKHFFLVILKVVATTFVLLYYTEFHLPHFSFLKAFSFFASLSFIDTVNDFEREFYPSASNRYRLLPAANSRASNDSNTANNVNMIEIAVIDPDDEEDTAPVALDN